MSIVDELPGLVVVHDEKGIGKIASADDSRVTIDMWVPQKSSRSFSLSGEFQNMILESITDLEKSISWGFITSAFLDNPKWSIAPRGDELDDSIEAISRSDSNVVIHTSNPPRPFEHAETMKDDIQLILEKELDQYDSDLMGSISGVVELVDWSLSWFLIRKRETDQEYHYRLSSLMENLDGACFSEYIFPYLPEIVKYRIIHHASTVVATKYLQRGPAQSLPVVEEAMNRRVRSFRNIISGFARSYDKKWLDSRLNTGRQTHISQRSRIRGT